MTDDCQDHPDVLSTMSSSKGTQAQGHSIAERFTPDPAWSYWPTPADIADDLVYWLLEPWHGRGEDIRVLEPSAGEGHLIRVIRNHLPEARVTAIEPSPVRAAALRAIPGIDVLENTLEEYLLGATSQGLAASWSAFDLAIMNPPFTLAGRPEAWAEHVLAVYQDPYVLAPGGLVGAVVPRIVLTGKSRRVRAVRDLVAQHGQVEVCRSGAFDPVGAKVSTALMWIQKPLDSPEGLGGTDASSSTTTREAV